VTQPIAQLLRLQIYTLVLGYSGLYLLRRCQAAQASDLARATITQVHGVPQGAASR
jgi:hypothetical protein